MAHTTNLHGIKNIKVEKSRETKHSSKSQKIVFETEEGRNHEVRVFGDFEALEVEEK